VKFRAATLAILISCGSVFAVSEVWSGPARRRDKVHPDLKLQHPKVTPEFLSSFKPTQLDFDMGWVIVDESARKYPEKITAEDLRRPPSEKKTAEPGDKPRITNRGEFLWSEGPNDLATRKNNEGLAFVLANDMDRARDIFEELRQNEPQFFPGRFNLGRIYLYFKQHREAIAEFEKCTQLVPQYSKNYFYLGKGYELPDSPVTLAWMVYPFDLTATWWSAPSNGNKIGRSAPMEKVVADPGELLDWLELDLLTLRAR
jgi:tetratricopeptide (TPR) repeat protein